MHIKTKVNIEHVVYYVCFNYEETTPVLHWVSHTPSGFNRLNELGEELTNKIVNRINDCN